VDTPWTTPVAARGSSFADDRAAVAWGLLCIAIGLLPIGVSTGILPANPASIHAPRWVLALCGAAFLSAGAMIVARGTACVADLAAFVLLVTLGVTGGWVALVGQSSALVGGVPMLGRHANAILARALFGFGALVSLALAAYAASRVCVGRGGTAGGGTVGDSTVGDSTVGGETVG
jgi:hypothetical protein